MVTAAKRQAAEDLRKIKAQAKAAKAEAKAVAAKKKAKAAKREETMERRAAGIRGTKGVLVSSSDIKDVELAKELAAAGAAIVPSHRHEVHVKKELITVYVTLHNVPAQKIDADSTTDAMLVVATPKHNKQYRLEFPFPHGMRVDAAKGDYTLESGVLKCVFPVTKMPADVVRAWTDRLESVRKSQRARFDVDKEGELVVRRRKTRLELEAVKADKAAAKATKATKAGDAKKDAKKGGKKEKAETTTTAAAKPAAPAAATTKAAAPAKAAASKPGPGAADDKAMQLRIASQAAKAIDASLKGRMAVARSAHERRLQCVKVSVAKKSVKEDRTQSAFARVLEEKRKELSRREERVAAASAPAKKGGAASPNAKSVRFA